MFNALLVAEEAIPAIIFIFVMAVVSIVSSRVTRKKKEQASKNNDTTSTSVQKTSSAESEHDEIIRKRMEKQMGKDKKNVYASRHEQNEPILEQQEVVRDKSAEEKAKQEKLKAELKQKHSKENAKKQDNHTHTHPVEVAPAKKEVRPSSAGSLGEVHDEGCYDHDDVRYVIEEVQSADSEADAGLQELQRIMVWSEIIDKPKYKRR